MGRYTGPSCKQCRREGTKLFLKGTKCFTEKCPVERRPYAPGQHGQNTARRRKSSEYSKQLREKQKIKRIYGISEQQFRNTFEKVASMPGITGHNLLAALESRLDNMIYRMGFAPSRKAARQLIRHRHVEINSKRVDIPSYSVAPGEEVKIRQASREVQPIHQPAALRACKVARASPGVGGNRVAGSQIMRDDVLLDPFLRGAVNRFSA